LEDPVQASAELPHHDSRRDCSVGRPSFWLAVEGLAGPFTSKSIHKLRTGRFRFSRRKLLRRRSRNKICTGFTKVYNFTFAFLGG